MLAYYPRMSALPIIVAKILLEKAPASCASHRRGGDSHGRIFNAGDFASGTAWLDIIGRRRWWPDCDQRFAAS